MDASLPPALGLCLCAGAFALYSSDMIAYCISQPFERISSKGILQRSLLISFSTCVCIYIQVDDIRLIILPQSSFSVIFLILFPPYEKSLF